MQVVKTAVAAGASWALAHWLFHSPKPYFAPLAAILSVQATVAESVARGIQRILGVIGGILLALVFTHWLGLHAWSLAVLVFVGMALATRLNLGPQGIPQVAISALLVIAIGAEVKGYAWARALDTALGALVAAGVSMLLWPPDFTPDAVDTLRLLALGLADILHEIRQNVVDGLTLAHANRHLARARAVEQGLHQARNAIARAETSLRWNFWHRRDQARLKQLRHALGVLDHILIQVRGIARTLFVTAERDVSRPSGALPPAVGRHLAHLLALMGDALKCYADLIREGDPEAAWHLETMLAAADEERDRLIAAGGAWWARDASHFLDIAAVLVDLEKMSQDLAVSSRMIVPVVAPRPQPP
ncbi:MAG: aromatic acid exporter family protein [Firmicutes bacterium]|nr:aromatic acid exporter family protein [Bacillota bacterium]